MKTNSDENISAKRAAQIILYKFGASWQAMGDDELHQAIDTKRFTDKQALAIRIQLDKLTIRLAKLCKMQVA